MYSSENSLLTPICFAKNMYKIYSLFLCMLCIFFLSGCEKKDSTPSFDEDVTIMATRTVTPTVKPTLMPTPTVKPSSSSALNEELTVESAQTMIEKQIDPKKYTVNLVTEDLKIDSTHYIAFLAHEKSIPLEPVLLVNKTNGVISCLSSDGKVSAFNMYSITSRQQSQDSIDCDWNGLFYNKDTQDHIIGTLQVLQNDTSSFEFSLNTVNSDHSSTITGVAHIIGNNAIFTDESEHYLTFTINEDTISVYDGDEAFFPSDSTINGDYIFQDYETKKDFGIGTNTALNLVKRLSTAQTQLPAPLSDYTLKVESTPIILRDRICYIINAFAELEDNEVLITTFYVSIDGSEIFEFDSIDDEPYAIVSLK